MPKFKIFIDCGNAAFEDEPYVEIGRILTSLSSEIHRKIAETERSVSGNLYDINGNKVGEWSYRRPLR